MLKKIVHKMVQKMVVGALVFMIIPMQGMHILRAVCPQIGAQQVRRHPLSVIFERAISRPRISGKMTDKPEMTGSLPKISLLSMQHHLDRADKQLAGLTKTLAVVSGQVGEPQQELLKITDKQLTDLTNTIASLSGHVGEQLHLAQQEEELASAFTRLNAATSAHAQAKEQAFKADKYALELPYRYTDCAPKDAQEELAIADVQAFNAKREYRRAVLALREAEENIAALRKRIKHERTKNASIKNESN